MQRARNIPVAWLGSGSCQNRPNGWIILLVIIILIIIILDKPRDLNSCTEHLFYNPVQENQQMLRNVVSFLLCSSNYHDMFRQLTAISGGNTFLVSYSSFVCVSGGCGLWFAWCGQLLWNFIPHMFRKQTAICKVLNVPRKLLQFCLHLGWSWIMFRSVWPTAVEFHSSRSHWTNHNPRPPETQTKLE
jgi:hypothetical protein